MSAVAAPHKPRHNVQRRAAAERLQISLRAPQQLFNSLDPSPFYDKDLDPDAEEFLVGWAEELPRKRPLHLVLHFETLPEDGGDRQWIADAIHNYFSGRAREARHRRQRLLRKGRVSLAIGVLFLLSCLFLVHWLLRLEPDSLWARALRESLAIAGWVAMWQPLQIYLYDWWPIREREALYRRMSEMSIEVRPPAPAARSAAAAPFIRGVPTRGAHDLGHGGVRNGA